MGLQDNNVLVLDVIHVRQHYRAIDVDELCGKGSLWYSCRYIQKLQEFPLRCSAPRCSPLAPEFLL